MLRPFHVIGGVMLWGDDNDGIALKDFVSGEVIGINLADQNHPEDAATLYIPLHSPTKSFFCEYLTYGYWDTGGADQWTELHLIERSEAVDTKNNIFTKHSVTGTIAENQTTPTTVPVNKHFYLIDAKLYFITEWGTLMSANAAGEYFIIRVDGYTFHRN